MKEELLWDQHKFYLEKNDKLMKLQHRFLWDQISPASVAKRALVHSHLRCSVKAQ